MQKHLHKYRGIVIQNDDPEMMGRVKVWVPQVSMTLYDKWNNDRDNDKKFTELGGNLACGLTPDILLRLKNCLPWATVEQPIFGMGTSTTYHADADFGQISNDQDTSVQHNIINKQPAASSPANNNTSQLSSQLQQSASSPSSSSAAINNYSNPSTSSNDLSYIANAAQNNQTTTAQTAAGSTANTTSNSSNVASVEITFQPNDRNQNNLYRTFTSSASISVEGGPVTTDNISATPSQSTTSSSTPTYSPPITYSPAPSVVNTAPAPKPVAPGAFDHSAVTSTVTNAPANAVAGQETVGVVFIPDNRNSANVGRVFTTTATIISDDGESLSINGNATNLSSGQTKVKKSDITNINIVYNDPTQNINLNSSALGALGPLLSTYSTPISSASVIPNSSANSASSSAASSSSSSSSVIMPPSTVPSTSFNRGGGGAELFALIFSSLLPFNTLLNTLVGAPNPDSKHAINQGQKFTNGTDPQQRTNPNQQLSADAKPVMRSPTQNNKVKGAISIPGVGAHVSVYFDDGNVLFPVVDGVFYTQEDYAGINDVAGTITP